nr:MAG TPA: polynucleotide kinase [Caudoviricetes sp.]
MRKEKDYRKDSIVKTEIYNEYIKDKYCVTAVFDDRDQVVNDCWRKLGLLCNQVWKGDF